MQPYQLPPTLDYIAAFFDGEGHITWSSHTLSFTQKNPTILLDIQALYGGRLRTVNKGKYLSHRLVMRRAETIAIAQAMLPHLRGRRNDILKLLDR